MQYTFKCKLSRALLQGPHQRFSSPLHFNARDENLHSTVGFYLDRDHTIMLGDYRVHIYVSEEVRSLQLRARHIDMNPFWQEIALARGAYVKHHNRAL